eukprot:TRINITY_DN10120_c0_g2_i2.p1 TRINITY_DN10120_c0_g2~~TRINITY_DN10120_c0_g2_i2.p1  ORF type:complete len:200 (+),score=56.78 TRINITY_DN10120_c0_g2_i2:38-637(+)
MEASSLDEADVPLEDIDVLSDDDVAAVEELLGTEQEAVEIIQDQEDNDEGGSGDASPLNGRSMLPRVIGPGEALIKLGNVSFEAGLVEKRRAKFEAAALYYQRALQTIQTTTAAHESGLTLAVLLNLGETLLRLGQPSNNFILAGLDIIDKGADDAALIGCRNLCTDAARSWWPSAFPIIKPKIGKKGKRKGKKKRKKK